MSLQVVIATNGYGFPVIATPTGGLPAQVASNGFGIPVVIVETVPAP